MLGQYALRILLGLLAGGIAGCSSAVEIVPHRALYSLSLGETTSRGGIVDARGAMFFEWLKTCDGWTMEQKIRMTLVNAQGGEFDHVSNYTSWESRDGTSFRFDVHHASDGEMSLELLGRASLSETGGRGGVSYAKPEEKNIELPPGSMFPTAHTRMLLEQAVAGESRFSRVVFDGNDERGAFEINAVILGPARPSAAAETDADPLVNRFGWRMRLAFYPLSSREPTPEFEVGLDLLDNGIARDLVFDYGDYTIRAELGEVEAAVEPAC